MESEYLLAPYCVAKPSHFTTASPDPRILSELKSIPFHKVPTELGPSRPDGLPELFWCCWVVGEHKIFNFFGNPHPGKPDVFDTSSCSELTVAELPAVLETALPLPPETAAKMAVIEVFNWEGKPELAFAVGSNYGGYYACGHHRAYIEVLLRRGAPIMGSQCPSRRQRKRVASGFLWNEPKELTAVFNSSNFAPHRRTTQCHASCWCRAETLLANRLESL
ncbi:hypothetical protein BDN71DRAFT_159617 [Pleurotus eryngii]|uniref:Uncharacterized protein n=1 Tax=Pleurotus eryngii TaxID=5323 RepID=A0A9P5ZP98_PLEER|nr:hypothetical protein BDN71DRAFT_159617 [Pleurotus eryngii]